MLTLSIAIERYILIVNNTNAHILLSAFRRKVFYSAVFIICLLGPALVVFDFLYHYEEVDEAFVEVTLT